MTSFTHLIKVILFALLGFSFASYWQLILGMSIAVTLGALLGTRIRYKVPEADVSNHIEMGSDLARAAHGLPDTGLTIVRFLYCLSNEYSNFFA